MTILPRALLAGLALACSWALAKPLDDINQYADRCAAELGAGMGAYMPIEIMRAPNDFADSEEIPVFWNQKEITFEETNAATGARQPGSGHWEFLFDGQPGALGFPDGANTLGRIREANRNALKCDYWSHVNPTLGQCNGGVRNGLPCTNAAGCPGVVNGCVTIPSGCYPGQRALQRDVGTCSNDRRRACAVPADCGGAACRDVVTWTFIFRRLVPPKPAQVAFNPSHPLFFVNFDAIAFKQDTGGACWFDTLATRSLQNANWWVAAAGTPAGVPRAGGRDTAKKGRATPFWMTPVQTQNLGNAGERCPACHGNGPILVTRWLNQGGLFIGNVVNEIPYWHPAQLFSNPFFKQFTAGGSIPNQNCGTGCHDWWSVGANTTPGGSIANAMVTTPGAGLASHHRRQLDNANNPLAKTCRLGPNEGQPCVDATTCGGGMCVAGQNAGVMREMPHPFSGTPGDWNTANQARFDAMKACLRTCTAGTRAGRVCEADAHCPGAGASCRPIDGTKCNNTTNATIPQFYGAQSPPPFGKKQLVDPPYEAVNVQYSRTDCNLAADGSETCKYRAEWRDPTAGESDYHAADKYYVERAAVANQPLQIPVTQRFCANTNTPVTATKTALPGSNWASTFVATGDLAACLKTELRLCGGYDFDSGINLNDAHSPVDSRNDGDAQRGTLVTACANPMKVTRSGFRLHRLTNRYVQTITLKNESNATVQGPMAYLLFNLSANATLFAPSGTTQSIVPTGTPFVNVDAGSGIAAGAEVSFQLEFVNPTNQGITYDARVRTGAGAL